MLKVIGLVLGVVGLVAIISRIESPGSGGVGVGGVILFAIGIGVLLLHRYRVRGRKSGGA